MHDVPRGAALSGVRVRRVKTLVFMSSGYMAGLVGIIIAAQLNGSHPGTGAFIGLNPRTGAVLVGIIVDAFVIGILSDGLIMMGVSSVWQVAIKGLVTVAAVVIDKALSKRSDSSSGLFQEPRGRRIREWNEAEGAARVRALAAACEVSEAAIPQNLDQPERGDHITGEHGDAFLNALRAQVHGVSLCQQRRMAAKRRNGRSAAPRSRTVKRISSMPARLDRGRHAPDPP